MGIPDIRNRKNTEDFSEDRLVNPLEGDVYVCTEGLQPVWKIQGKYFA